jgi:ketosteroid isomerase-like protein
MNGDMGHVFVGQISPSVSLVVTMSGRDDERTETDRLVRETWSAVSRGDFAVLDSTLAPDAKWRAVEDGPWNCENRSMILRVMKDRTRQDLVGDIDSVLDVGDRIVVGFRPSGHGPDAWPLDDGVRYVVLTLRDGLVIEMKGCIDRHAAFEYASAG